MHTLAKSLSTDTDPVYIATSLTVGYNNMRYWLTYRVVSIDKIEISRIWPEQVEHVLGAHADKTNTFTLDFDADRCIMAVTIGSVKYAVSNPRRFYDYSG